MKKFTFALFTTLAIAVSTLVHAGIATSGTPDTIGKATIQSPDTVKELALTCPPFCA